MAIYICLTDGVAGKPRYTMRFLLRLGVRFVLFSLLKLFSYSAAISVQANTFIDGIFVSLRSMLDNIVPSR